MSKEPQEHNLDLPDYFVLHRSQADGDPVPVVDAMFREEEAARRYVSCYRKLEEHEFLTIEQIDVDSGTPDLLMAITAGTMAFVITEDGPRAVPKELAPLYGHCDCDKEEDDDE